MSPSKKSPMDKLIALLTAKVVKFSIRILFALLSGNRRVFPPGESLQDGGIPSATLVPIPVNAVLTHVPVPAIVLTVTGEAVNAILLITHVPISDT
jgi:hypothetical protein